MRKFDTLVSEKMEAALKRTARDYYMLFSSAELPDLALEHVKDTRLWCRRPDSWSGNRTTPDAIKLARNGDLSAVEASDAIMREIEDKIPSPSARRQVIDDVAGGMPNVSAYLASAPLTMRRKAMNTSEFSPIVLVVDLTSSAVINADMVRRRGVAILALARVLSARRPVELWAGCSLDANNGRDACHVYFQLETQPLDLARAAFLLSDVSVSRQMCYGIAAKLYGYKGAWPYYNEHAYIANCFEVHKRISPDASDTLSLPPIHGSDPLVKDPVGFITTRLAQYCGDDA